MRRRRTTARWALALTLATVAWPALAPAPLLAQERLSARLAGLNPNLAGTWPDVWTDAWRSPVRVPTAGTAGIFAAYRRGEDEVPDLWEAGLALTSGGPGLALLVRTAEDSAGAHLYGGSAAATLGLGTTSVGARVDVIRDETAPASSFTGIAFAAGLHTVAEFGSLEAWGEIQKPDAETGNAGYAVEAVLASPDPNVSGERLEPVIAARVGRHDVERFNLTAGGPVTWYEVSFGLRRSWGAAGAFAIALRRGEWKARSACAEGDSVCVAVVDPAIGAHAATSLDAAVEFAFSTSLRLRAGGTWALDGTAAEYEDLWPAELRRVGALRPGTIRGAFFGLGLRPSPTLQLDIYGYPGFLDDHGAKRHLGAAGAQLSVRL